MMKVRALRDVGQAAVLTLLAACSAVDDGAGGSADASANEGDDAGECGDGADNDINGLFDCQDPGCAGAPACTPSDSEHETDDVQHETDEVPPRRTEVWTVRAATAVDVLFVVDNSSSMAAEQAALGVSGGTLVETLRSEGVGFHIGFVTTELDANDPNRGRLVGSPPVLTEAMADANEVFATRSAVGSSGSGFERGFDGCDS